tara:strand:- start:238 stop:435 length:198 start_codon:yes stop_codon:yes gene_type:complete
MKLGDLVRTKAFLIPDSLNLERRLGVILTWVRYGGSGGTVWEVFYPDGDTEYWDESELELVNESR